MSLKEAFIDVQGPHEGRIRVIAVSGTSASVDVSAFAVDGGFVSLVSDVRCWYKYGAGAGTASASATSGGNQSFMLPPDQTDSHRLPPGVTRLHVVATSAGHLRLAFTSPPVGG